MQSEESIEIDRRSRAIVFTHRVDVGGIAPQASKLAVIDYSLSSRSKRLWLFATGTGFAPFRGGPIQHIRQTGVAPLLEKLRQLQARHGDRFAPRPGWDHPALLG